MALLAAAHHLEGGELNDVAKANMLADVLSDEKQSLETKISAIQSSDVGMLDFKVIDSLLNSAVPKIQSEAVYLLAGDQRGLQRLRSIVEDQNARPSLRADAIISLDALERNVDRLVKLCSTSGDLGETAARLLFGASLTEDQRKVVAGAWGEKRIGKRLLDQTSEKRDVNSLLNSLLDNVKETGDATRGRRLFANGRLLQCNTCHAVDNRGARIGPELTKVGRNQSRGDLLRSILLPSERVSPQFQAWTIIGKDGQSQTGYHYASNSRVETFVNAKGEEFEIHQDDIAERHALSTSMMPEGLVDHLTTEELGDLLAYLSE